MKIDDKINKLLAKVRSPLSLEYISYNILHLDKEESLSILNELIEIDVIEKKGSYYQIKRKK